jgi:hypothetical protein
LRDWLPSQSESHQGQGYKGERKRKPCAGRHTPK